MVKCLEKLAQESSNQSLSNEDTCYREALSRLVPVYQDRLSSLQLNMPEIATELANTIEYHQKLVIEISDSKDIVSLDCALKK